MSETNQHSSDKVSSDKVSKEEQRKNRVKEYNKKYYEKHKQDWNDYTPKICECGMTVTSLTIHKKTKLHKKFMEVLNARSISTSSPSVPPPALAIGLGLGLSSR